jgi:UDP-N-acetylglucosamine 4,6-dehydratase
MRDKLVGFVIWFRRPKWRARSKEAWAVLKGNILITGGAGFLGRSILRRIDREGWPANVTIYSRDEHKQAEIKRRWPDVRLVLGDIQNLDRLAAAAAGHDLIIHAAALKFIPEAEYNVFECIDVNVIGSRNVALAAMLANVPTVVGLSTDKAAAPLNTYGATKMLMERTFGEINTITTRGKSATRAVLVRYGNVVSSSGSVIPLFRHQLATLGHVEITDKRMTRFWLTMDQAIDLIAAAAGRAHEFPGGTFVYRCGAMRIADLARLVVEERDAALTLGAARDIGAIETVDARIREVGLRPGEKLHETLLLPQEAPRTLVPEPWTDVLDRPIEELGRYQVIMPPTHQAALPSVRLVTAAESEGVYEAGYSSDNPDFWITPAEMLAMIEDAATI